MNEVIVRMRRVSDDLREIRTRLEHISGSHDADRQMVDEVLQLDLIREFKSSLDDVRNFLWDYFQQASSQYGTMPDHAQEFRLKRATEMLRSVQDDITLPTGHEQLHVQSLFERLQRLADVTVERHFAKKDD
jgi:hypothetical protein